MAQPLLIDVSCLCDEHTDSALEFMAKAVGQDPPGNDIWEPHPNPFVRRIVELFTERGLTRIASVKDELAAWLAGDRFQPKAAGAPIRPAGAMARWSPGDIALANLYLESMPPESFTLDDWMLLVDFLVQKYLPATDLRAEADWLATRSNIMGRVQAAMREATESDADTILASLPSVEEVGRRFGMTPEQGSAIAFGRARCCEHVVGLSDAIRQRMRNLVVDYQEAVVLKDPAQRHTLQTRLFDSFGDMNRDWRRIAVTEATENLNQGFIAAQPVGSKVRRVEKYRGACAFCRSIDGRVLTVVDPSAAVKDGDAEVWVGKTNVGRSASTRKRVGGELVDREPNELWWAAAGAQHPHCRGAWVREVEGVSPDPEFEAFLANLKKNRGR